MDFIIMMVALFAIMYFLMIRPQQKRARKDQEMRSQLAPGDRVLLTSGLFATITHAGEKQFIVELAPDVQITVLKGSVARKVLPEDEEFEFTDEAGFADLPGGLPQSRGGDARRCQHGRPEFTSPHPVLPSLSYATPASSISCARWQLVQRPGATSVSSGRSVRQRSTA